MAKRSMQVTTYTPTAVANAANMTDALYGGVIQGGTATQRINIIEVMETGQAGASTPTLNVLARDSTIGVTSAASTHVDSPLDASTAALATPPVVGNGFSGTKPQRGVSHLLNLAFNAFGGLVRWVAAPGEEITVITATQPLGEISLSAFTGGTTGLMGSHVIYEPFVWATLTVLGGGLLSLMFVGGAMTGIVA